MPNGLLVVLFKKFVGDYYVNNLSEVESSGKWYVYSNQQISRNFLQAFLIKSVHEKLRY
jgi:hypothetical protein